MSLNIFMRTLNKLIRHFLKTFIECHSNLDLSHFNKRHDRTGYYKMCLACMVELARDVNYPPVRERGGGNLYPRISG